MIYDAIIIGGGASGLYLAAQLPNQRVLILEKNTRLGLKLLISGNGQCNLTHGGPIAGFKSHYGGHWKFVKHALNRHTNQQVLEKFGKMGVETIEREDGKIFPVSMRSKDVLNALVTSIKSYDQTEIKTGVQVLSITENNLGFSVGVKGESFTTKSVVLATGGYTYPKLGTTGDGYLMADKLGHEIVAPKPALAAVYIKSDALKELQGLVIREMSCTVERQKKRIYSFSGDILCTHFGLSGPGILDHSRYIEKGDVLKLNWAGIEADKLNHIILEVIASHGRNPLSFLMNQLNLPDRVKQFVLKEVQLNGLMKLAELTKENRKKIVDALTGYEVRINRLSDLNEAMVTSGGVGLRQINPKTMMSKIINGLYFVGEVMDVDGDTGGYNLQWAFASAYVAAEQIKQLDGEDAYAK